MRSVFFITLFAKTEVVLYSRIVSVLTRSNSLKASITCIPGIKTLVFFFLINLVFHGFTYGIFESFLFFLSFILYKLFFINFFAIVVFQIWNIFIISGIQTNFLKVKIIIDKLIFNFFIVFQVLTSIIGRLVILFSKNIVHCFIIKIWNKFSLKLFFSLF